MGRGLPCHCRFAGAATSIDRGRDSRDQAIRDSEQASVLDLRHPSRASLKLLEYRRDLLLCYRAPLGYLGSDRTHTHSNKNPFDLVQGRLVPAAVVKLRCAG